MKGIHLAIAVSLAVFFVLVAAYFSFFYTCPCCSRELEGKVMFLASMSNRTDVVVEYRITSPPTSNASDVHLELILGDFRVPLYFSDGAWTGYLGNTTYVATWNDTDASGSVDSGDRFTISCSGPREFRSGDSLVVSVTGYHGWREASFYFP